MASNKLIFLYLLFVLFASYYSSSEAQEELKVISTSQEPSFVRWISEDGGITIYQRRSGALLYSTNYSVEKILEDKPGTNYEIVSARNYSFILIIANNSLYSFENPVAPNKIYKLKIGNLRPEPVGTGIAPKLHPGAGLISYYSPSEKKLHFFDIENHLINFHVEVAANYPFWVPDVVAIDKNNILYTDMNKDGIVGIGHLERSTKKQSLILKSENVNRRIELCLSENGLYVGQFSSDEDQAFTQIIHYPKDSILSFKGKLIYEEKSYDLGNMICNYDQNIYFLKNADPNNKLIQEVAEINVKETKISILTSLKHATSIFSLSDKLLTMHNGKTLVLKGRNDMKELTKLPSENAKAPAEPTEDSAPIKEATPTTAEGEGK